MNSFVVTLFQKQIHTENICWKHLKEPHPHHSLCTPVTPSNKKWPWWAALTLPLSSQLPRGSCSQAAPAAGRAHLHIWSHSIYILQLQGHSINIRFLNTHCLSLSHIIFIVLIVCQLPHYYWWLFSTKFPFICLFLPVFLIFIPECLS